MSARRHHDVSLPVLVLLAVVVVLAYVLGMGSLIGGLS